MTKKQYTITIVVLIIIIALSTFVIINKRSLGQKIQSLTGINPFIDYMSSSIKNNNPLNIRHNDTIHWIGETFYNGERNGDFARFDSLENGIRAAIVNLHSYITIHNTNTIRTIIERWAPSSDDNDDSAYEQTVMSQLNKIYPSLTSTTTLSGDYAQLANIAWAMSAVEQGFKNQPPQQSFIDVQQKYF